MRHCGLVSKKFIFVLSNESLFTADYRTFYCKGIYSSARGLYSTHTSQIVKDANTDFPTAYNPKDVENNWYSWWEKQGYFVPNMSATGKPFNIVLPPPNVTGTLHLGHALTCTIQDVLARWHRMQGCPVVWIPGLDHAGIATQVTVERMLWQQQKLTRHDVGRDKFVEEVWRWKERQGRVIAEQLRRLGLSLDWSREMFTMDPKSAENMGMKLYNGLPNEMRKFGKVRLFENEVQSVAVTEAFIRLFDAGLVYRANSLVNWSCVLQSAISDVEVNFKEVTGATPLEVSGYFEPVEFGVLTNFAYKLCDRDGEIVVSTTRVETMLGDTAVAVHPLDARYKNVIGEHVWHPFREERLPIICDDFVNPDLGTGAVKVTPAHDFIDFEVGKRHNLEMISVIDEKGELNEKCGKFADLKRFDARKCVTEQLAALGLLRGKQDHTMQVPFCSRSGDVVELLLKPQWFVNCKGMAQRALRAVQGGQLKIDPDFFEKTWYSWLHDVRDWCVSRQLWWGHQIPVYECSSVMNSQTSVWVAARNVGDARKKASTMLGVPESDILNVCQDSDVLDTWFSSALLPFSALGWPDKTEKHYPLTLMETGHDILFFWVARMVMLGTELTGQLPFKNVLLHGIICDAQGRKMSKSLGNVVLPEDLIFGISLEDLNRRAHKSFEAGLLSKSELAQTLDGQKKMFPKGIAECGADALRFTLCSVNIKNHFINFDIQQCHAHRQFCNKIWQASKYTRLCVQKAPAALDSDLSSSQANLSKLDKWILSRLAHMVSEVNKALTASDFHIATSTLKTFLYSEFCDFYLETTKPVLKVPNTQAAVMACRTLLCCLVTALHALSPFMPFVTEELYHHLPHFRDHCHSESIMVAQYPTHQEWEQWRDMDLENEIQLVINIIGAVRRLKTKHGIIGKPEVFVVTSSPVDRNIYTEHQSVVKALLGCRDVVVSADKSLALQNNPVAEAVGSSGCVYLITKQALDTHEEESQAREKEEWLLKELVRMNKIMTASGYKSKAPLHIQEVHALKISSLKNELRRVRELQESLRRLL